MEGSKSCLSNKASMYNLKQKYYPFDILLFSYVSYIIIKYWNTVIIFFGLTVKTLNSF